MRDDSLVDLLAALARCFPAHAPLSMRPSAGSEEWARLGGRFPGGHARRWFAACDGQTDELPSYDGHCFCSRQEAEASMNVADEIRADPEGYWIAAHWIAFADDLAGHQIMIDDRDGRVLSVAHDDDHVRVLAESPEAWVEALVRGHADGTIVWDTTFGLVEKRVLDEVSAYRADVAAGRVVPLPTSQQRITMAAVAILALFLVLVVVWLEAHR
jgi:hypothetical protein